MSLKYGLQPPWNRIQQSLVKSLLFFPPRAAIKPVYSSAYFFCSSFSSSSPISSTVFFRSNVSIPSRINTIQRHIWPRRNSIRRSSSMTTTIWSTTRERSFLDGRTPSRTAGHRSARHRFVRTSIRMSNEVAPINSVPNRRISCSVHISPRNGQTMPTNPYPQRLL